MRCSQKELDSRVRTSLRSPEHLLLQGSMSPACWLRPARVRWRVGVCRSLISSISISNQSLTVLSPSQLSQAPAIQEGTSKHVLSLWGEVLPPLSPETPTPSQWVTAAAGGDQHRPPPAWVATRARDRGVRAGACCQGSQSCSLPADSLNPTSHRISSLNVD